MCITSPKFLVAINGELVGFFGSNRGLRQGDPISPYFCIIAMVVFFGLFHKVVTNPSFKFHAKCKKLGINHLYFADDIMLFCGVDGLSIILRKDALEKFQKRSRLKANPGKTTYFSPGLMKMNKIGLARLLVTLWDSSLSNTLVFLSSQKSLKKMIASLLWTKSLGGFLLGGINFRPLWGGSFLLGRFWWASNSIGLLSSCARLVFTRKLKEKLGLSYGPVWTLKSIKQRWQAMRFVFLLKRVLAFFEQKIRTKWHWYTTFGISLIGRMSIWARWVREHCIKNKSLWEIHTPKNCS